MSSLSEVAAPEPGQVPGDGMPGWVHAGLAIFAGLLAALIAVQHPLWPDLLTPGWLLWCFAVYRRPSLWLKAVPALLPVAGFSAWSGWIGVEEFDLLVLGAATACHARMAVAKAAGASVEGVRGQPAQRFRPARIGLCLLAVWWLLALARGLADAGGMPLGWFEGYEEPLNCLRVAKSLLLVLLLLPSLRELLRSRPRRAGHDLAVGVATALGLAAMAIVCERAGYPGLLNFSTPYRSTGLFWEMHVGGAALDGFLALAIPFVAFLLAQARDRRRWALAAALAVVAGYACLTTFSRGLYLGVAVSLMVLAAACSASRGRAFLVGAGKQRAAAREPWRVVANRALTVVLIVEVLAVLGLGDFMGMRLAAGERDLGGRVRHWRESLSLLRTPSEWLFGRGLGRFPANYSHSVPGRAMPGRLQWLNEGGDSHLRIYRPQHAARSRGAFELLQRVPVPTDGNHVLAMDLRAPQWASLRVSICHKHLLYAASCVQLPLTLPPGDEWRRISLAVPAPARAAGGWSMPGFGFFSLRPEGPAEFIEVDNLSLVDGQGNQLLANGDFSAGMAHWFFAGYHYFVPWHVDSLFVETLIDQGVIGLLLLLALLAMALRNLLRGPGSRHGLAPYLLAALAGSLVVGVFSSLLDMPRCAFLFYLLLCCALFLDEHDQEDLYDRPAPFPQVSLELPRIV